MLPCISCLFIDGNSLYYIAYLFIVKYITIKLVKMFPFFGGKIAFFSIFWILWKENGKKLLSVLYH